MEPARIRRKPAFLSAPTDFGIENAVVLRKGRSDCSLQPPSFSPGSPNASGRTEVDVPLLQAEELALSQTARCSVKERTPDPGEIKRGEFEVFTTIRRVQIPSAMPIESVILSPF